nr:flagellin [Lysinibacillus timonensis]
MRVRHNISALNTNNKLQQNNKTMSKSLERLSSGLRINSAADDAAGLSISEKMRGQIRGLEQAEHNIQDGISLVQTAESGLFDIHEQLHRARELTVQASNDTLTTKDREVIQKEIDEIKAGINDIANHTHFNNIKLLNGEKPPIGGIQGGNGRPGYNFENALSLNVDTIGSFALSTDLGYPGTEDDNNQILIYGSGSNSRPQLIIDNVSYDIKNFVSQNTVNDNGTFKTIYDINNVEVTQTVKIVNDKFEFRYNITNNSSEDRNIGFYFHMDTMLGNDDTAPFRVNGTDLTTEEGFSGSSLPDTFEVYNDSGNPDIKVMGVLKGPDILEEPSELRVGRYSDVSNALGWTDTNDSVGDSGYGLLWSNRTIVANSSFEVNTFYGMGVPPTIEDPTNIATEEGPYDISLQVGANSGNNFIVGLSDVRAAKLDIDDVEVDPIERAIEALEKIDGAIQKVSSERTKYGAYQNGLENTYANVTNTSLNLTASESRIRDVDMAKEMMKQTKDSILTQAAQAMLAQANQQPQSVLQLIS